MPVEVDDELDQYAKKDDELEKYAKAGPAAPTALHGSGADATMSVPGGEGFPGVPNPIPSAIPNEEATRRIGPLPSGDPLTPVEQEKRLKEYNPGGQLVQSALAPSLGKGLVTAPLRTGASIAGGYGGGKLARSGASLFGAGETGQDIAELGGGLAGWLVGGFAPEVGGGLKSIGRKILLDPVTGEPTLGPSSLAKRVLRTSTPFEEAGAPLPSTSEFYENKGADITKRGREQDLLDRRAAMEARRKPSFERDATKLNVPFAGEEVPPVRTSPFGEATSSASPQGNAQLPSIGTPIQRNEPNVSLVSKFERPAGVQKSRIIQPGTPEAEPPHVEGSYWSFGEGALRKAVMGGDRDAAIVYKQRFGQLPEGASYLTDVGAKPNKGLYRSKQ